MKRKKLSGIPLLSLAALTLAVILMLVEIAGCGKKEVPAPPGRYEGIDFPVPENIDVDTQTAPLWDEETGELTVFTCRLEVTDRPEGGFDSRVRYYLVTSAAGTGEAREEEIPLEEDLSVIRAVILPEAAYLLMDRIEDRNVPALGRPKNYCLGRYDRNTGEVTVSEIINRFFSVPDLYTEDFAADGDGVLYVAGKNEILVFSPGFIYQKTVPLTDSVAYICVPPASDGKPLIVSSIFYKKKLFRSILSLDPDTGETTEFCRFEATDGSYNLRFGEDGNFYFGSSAGIWRVRLPENTGAGNRESSPPELVLDYTVSDLIPDRTYFAAALGEDRFVLIDRSERDGRRVSVPMLYVRAEDTDLTDVTVLTLAYDKTDAALVSKIVTFNKAHRDVRIVTADYAQYNEADNPSAGSERLALDIASGVLKPDIVVSFPDSDAVRQLYEKKLYADLGPYLAEDGLVNRDNLFGAVQHVFDDGRGGLWGLSTGFSLVTLVAPRALLPESAAEQGFWTLSEMTDFAASVPEGVSFTEITCREYFSAILDFSEGLEEFIDLDTGTCSFDSPAFCRILTYLASLPSLEEALASGALPWAGLPEEEVFLPYLEGKIALRSFELQSPAEVIGLSALFGTDDYVLIGLPASEPRDGAGIYAEMNDAVILTSFCEAPDAGWEMIRSLFEGEVRMTVSTSGAIHDPLPVLRSQTDRMIDSYNAGGMEFCFYFDGSSEMRRGDPENPADPAALDRPGIVSFFTEEKREKLYAILDRAGTPLFFRTDTQITQIVSEELSALYAGSCSPEDCAARIQSRVGIRLAEHS